MAAMTSSMSQNHTKTVFSVNALDELKDQDDFPSDKSISTSLLEGSENRGDTVVFLSSSTITIALLCIWFILSSGIVVYNKYIIDTLNFKFPATVTCWHLAFAAGVTQSMAHFTPWLDGRKQVNLSVRDYVDKIVPIGVLFSGSLVCNNIPYLTLSIAFMQMLKGLGPATILFASWTLNIVSPTSSDIRNIILVVIGVVISSLGEVKFALSGVFFQIIGLIFDAYRLGFIRRLLVDRHKMDSLVSLYYFAPACAIMLAVVAALTEWNEMSHDHLEAVGIWTLFGNGCVAFALNVVTVMLIGRTGTMTIPLCAIFKNIAVVMSSVVLWGTIVTTTQMIGFAITTLGLLYYSVGAQTIHTQVAVTLRCLKCQLSGNRRGRANAEISPENESLIGV